MLSPKKIKGPHICCPFDIGADNNNYFLIQIWSVELRYYVLCVIAKHKLIKSLQESIFHYQYSDWKEAEKDPDLPEGNIGDAIYKLHEVPLYWWLTGLFLLYLTPGRIVCRVKIYIKIRSVDLKVFFFFFKWNE